MLKLEVSGVDLQSKQGLAALLDFAERNQLMNESVDVVAMQLISVEEEVASEMMSDYWDTLRSAMPNCFD